MEREELDGVLVQHVHYTYVIARIVTLAKGAPSRAHNDINFDFIMRSWAPWMIIDSQQV